MFSWTSVLSAGDSAGMSGSGARSRPLLRIDSTCRYERARTTTARATSPFFTLADGIAYVDLLDGEDSDEGQGKDEAGNTGPS